MWLTIAPGNDPRIRRWLRSPPAPWKTLPHIEMALAPDGSLTPADLDLVMPRLVADDEAGVLCGINSILEQVKLHRSVEAENGNANLASGDRLPRYPVLDATGSRVVEGGRGIRTPLGWIAALNLSIGSSVGRPFDPTDPINLATRRATRLLPVVIAAGNAKEHLTGPRALSGWARAPWVISVASLRDGALAPDTAFGRPADRTSWPDVAAPDDLLTTFDATTGEVTAFRGTSSAAPVVARQLIAFAAFCLTLRAALSNSQTPLGIPRVGWALVDRGIDPAELPASGWQYGALPQIGIEPEGARRLAATASDAGLRLDPTPTPTLLRRLLRASATPMEGYEPFQVGSGEVSYGTTAVFLARMTAGRMLRYLLPGHPTVAAVAASLDGVPLTGDYLASALEIWHANEIPWVWDFRRQTLWSLSYIRPDTKELT
jgi:hypothetical protein